MFIVFGRPGCKQFIYLGVGYVHVLSLHVPDILAQALQMLVPSVVRKLKKHCFTEVTSSAVAFSVLLR